MIDLSLAHRLLVLATASLLLGCGGADDGDRSPPGVETGEDVNEVAVASSDSSLPAADPRVVYVPDYSHIYHGSNLRRFALTTTLSIRNTDRPVSDPVIESVMISTRAGQGLSFTSRGVPIVRPQE